MKTNLKQLFLTSCEKIKELWFATERKNIITFSVFLLISAAFWFLISMNEEQQLDFNLHVEITDLPENVTLLTSELPVVNVSLRDKGTALVRHKWGKTPPLNFKFGDLPAVNNKLLIGTLQTNNAIRQLFSSANIGRVKPDSLMIPFTRRPGKKLPVKLTVAEIFPGERYIQSGPVELLTDSITLYSATALPRSLRSISTVPLNATELTDTVEMLLELDIPQGMRAIPEEVKVRIPVEPLVAQERKIPVEIDGAPHGTSVVPFPGTVTVSYLVSMSHYHSEAEVIKVTANYRRRNSHTSKMPLTITAPRTSMRNITVTPDSVEYLVEQH